jgi:hypothetical protein
VAAFIVIACVATLWTPGVITIGDASDAARALGPLAGSTAETLFPVGLLAASLFGLGTVPLTSAYDACEAFGWESGLDHRPRDARAFYVLLSFFVGFAALFLPIPRPAAAVVAIGSWDPPDSQLRNGVDEFEREARRSLGVRAEICSTLVDDDGHAVAAELTLRQIAISGDQLRRIPEVIAVAGGRSKAAAVRAVLKGGYITSLVTDASVARTLLDGVPDLKR